MLSSSDYAKLIAGFTRFESRLWDRLTVHGKEYRAVNFLDSLAPAEREAFTAVAIEESFPRSSRLMSEGEPANYVMVILSGWTRITVERVDATTAGSALWMAWRNVAPPRLAKVHATGPNA